jgi:CBS domain-containing protein
MIAMPPHPIPAEVPMIDTLDAASVMTRDVFVAAPNETVASLAQRMSDKGISALPVCEADGTLVGIISEGDLMRPFGQANAMRRSWWLDVLAEGTDLAPEFLDYIRLDTRRARDLMSRNVISVVETTPLAQIADILEQHRIKRVPVLRDGKVVGIVSRADIIRAMARAVVAAAARRG